MSVMLISSKELLKEVKTLESSFRGKYTDRQMTALLAAVKNYQVRHLEKAVDKALQDNNRLPTISALIQYVRLEHDHDYSLKERVEVKRFWNKETNNKIATDTKTMILKMLGGETTRGDFYKAMLALHEKYPKGGFDLNAAKYKREIIDKHGPGQTAQAKILNFERKEINESELL